MKIDNFLLRTLATSQQATSFSNLQSQKTTTTRLLGEAKQALQNVQSSSLPCLASSHKAVLEERIQTLTTQLQSLQRSEGQILSSVRKKGVGALAFLIISAATAALYSLRSNPTTSPRSFDDWSHKDWLDEHQRPSVHSDPSPRENLSNLTAKAKDTDSINQEISTKSQPSSPYDSSFELFSSSESLQDDPRWYREFLPAPWPAWTPSAALPAGSRPSLALPTTSADIAQYMQEQQKRQSTYTNSGKHTLHKRAAFRFSSGEILSDLDRLQTDRSDLIEQLKSAAPSTCNAVLSKVIAQWSQIARTNYPANPLGGFEWIKFFWDHVVIETLCDKSDKECLVEHKQRQEARDLLSKRASNPKEKYHWGVARDLATEAFERKEWLKSSLFIPHFLLLKNTFMNCYVPTTTGLPGHSSSQATEL